MSNTYAVDVPVINVSEQARNESNAAWLTLKAFSVTLSHMFRTLFRTYLFRTMCNSLKCVACYLCATVCPAECIYIEAGEHPNPEIEKFPIQFNIDMLRCIYCGFCVDACPEEAIIMSREHHQTAYNRSETLFTIENLIERPGIKDKGPGYRPNDPLIQSQIYDKSKDTCDYPSVVEERHSPVLYESMINKRK